MSCTICPIERCPIRALVSPESAELVRVLITELSVFHVIASAAVELLERNEQAETDDMAMALRMQDLRLHQIIRPLLPPPGGA